MTENSLQDYFYGDGRGPELKRIHWADDGRTVVAFDFLPPDRPASEIQHLRIVKPQVVMITPDEVAGIGQRKTPAGKCIADLGRSDWLETFAPVHLARCHHFQLVFYDEVVDLICDDLLPGNGPFARA